MCPTEPQTFGSESVSFSPVMMDNAYIVLFFTYLYFSYLCFTEANEPASPAGTKRKVFLRRNFIRKQSGTWRSADTKTLDAARRTEEQKQESSFALFRVPGYLISRLSFSVNVLYSKSTLDAEGKQDLKRSTNMETGTLSTRVETYGQDGKYNYSF